MAGVVAGAVFAGASAEVSSSVEVDTLFWSVLVAVSVIALSSGPGAPACFVPYQKPMSGKLTISITSKNFEDDGLFGAGFFSVFRALKLYCPGPIFFIYTPDSVEMLGE